MLYFPTIISVLEVLAVTVPVLLTVAFVTIAERKTMASMQRRLGPNAVGCLKWNLTHKRTFHSSCDALSELYCNRKAPVIEFSDDVLFTSTNLLNPSVILSFFKSLKGKVVSECKDLLSPITLSTSFNGLKYLPFNRFPLLVKLRNVRHFNTFNQEFIEWLRGFVDSEGSFYIEPNNKGRSYRFNFQIVLHVDDIKVLQFIKSNLGIGEVRERGTNATFTIRTQQDIVKLIDIFSKYPLNSKKYLDFSDFKRAFELYTSSYIKSPELILEIIRIKDSMNKGRTNFSMPSEHNYRITPYWLLGFVEGDGSFFIRRKNYQLYFSIVQHSLLRSSAGALRSSRWERDFELMNKIGDFLYDLPFINKQTMRKSSIRISESS